MPRRRQLTATSGDGRFVVRFAPTSMTAEQYNQVRRRLEEAGDFPPDGMEYHVRFGSEGNLRVSEIWASREQFHAFGERLTPAISEAGIEPSEPQILDVYNMIRP
jgi:hypothetical protein